MRPTLRCIPNVRVPTRCLTAALLAAVTGCASNPQTPTVVAAAPKPIDLHVVEAQPDPDELAGLPKLWQQDVARSPFKIDTGEIGEGGGNFDDLFGPLSIGVPRNPYLTVEPTPTGPSLVERRPGGDAKKAMEAADKAFTAGKYDEALEGYQKVVDADPAFVKPYFYMAAVYKAKRDYERADEYVERGLRLGPRDAFGYAVRAEMLEEQGKDDIAHATLARALALDPYAPPALRLLEKLGSDRKPGMRPRISIERPGRFELTVRGNGRAWQAFATCRALLLYDGRLQAEYLQGVPAQMPSPLTETTCGFLATAVYREARQGGAPSDPDLERWSKAYDAGLLREALIYELMATRHPEVLQLLPDETLRMVEYTRLFVVPPAKAPGKK